MTGGERVELERVFSMLTQQTCAIPSKPRVASASDISAWWGALCGLPGLCAVWEE